MPPRRGSAGRPGSYTARMNRSRLALLALVVGFLVFRAALFAVTTASEFALYHDYGEAVRHTSLAELYRTRDVEYPQLAVLFGSLAGMVTDALPPGAGRLRDARPDEGRGDVLSRYEVALGLVLFAVDVSCLVLVYLIARKLYPNETRARRVGRLVLYALLTGLLGLILYDRQDLVVAWFALLALLALAHGRPTVGYAILVLGTAYKLVPALLLPVWVLAAAARRAGPGATPRRFLMATVREAAVAAVLLAAWPVAIYLCSGGERAFVFLTFHSVRGLQLEAPAAWPVLFLDHAAEVRHGYGSYNLHSSLADRIAVVLRFAMLGAVVVAGLIATRGFWRMAAWRGREKPAVLAPPFLAGTGVGLLPHTVAAALLVWMAFILANKVGSPQYLLWVAPLVPLLPLRTAREWGWVGLFAFVLLATTLVYPCRYQDDVLGPFTSRDPVTRRGPNVFGVALLVVRSLSLAAATVWLAVMVWQSPLTGYGRDHGSCSPEAPR